MPAYSILPTVAQEADRLEAEINAARLTVDQEVGVWSVYGDHGLAPARHVLTAMKTAKSPMQMRQKAAMTPADDFDRLGQQVAQAARTAAMQAGADKTRVLQAVQAFIAQLVPTRGRTTLTDQGDQSVLPSKAKQAPFDAPQSAYEALVKGEPLSTVPTTKAAPVDAFAAAILGDLRSDMMPR